MKGILNLENWRIIENRRIIENQDTTYKYKY